MTARELIEALLLFPMEEEIELRCTFPDEGNRVEVAIYGRGAHVDVGQLEIPAAGPGI